jgi:hypothetical protein
MANAVAERDIDWLLACEDDVSLFDPPPIQVPEVLERVDAYERTHDRRVGAVLSYGRDLNTRTGRTVPVDAATADHDDDWGLLPVDVGAWGASLIRAGVVRSGILPDPELFFGFEDFDFWMKVHEAGYDVLLDLPRYVALAQRVTDVGRTVAFGGERPVEYSEPWRVYYATRNFIPFARRHGKARWLAVHVLLTFRRAAQTRRFAGWSAALRGLVHGFRGKLGPDDRYRRKVGELR